MTGELNTQKQTKHTNMNQMINYFFFLNLFNYLHLFLLTDNTSITILIKIQQSSSIPVHYFDVISIFATRSSKLKVWVTKCSQTEYKIHNVNHMLTIKKWNSLISEFCQSSSSGFGQFHLNMVKQNQALSFHIK